MCRKWGLLLALGIAPQAWAAEVAERLPIMSGIYAGCLAGATRSAMTQGQPRSSSEKSAKAACSYEAKLLKSVVIDVFAERITAEDYAAHKSEVEEAVNSSFQLYEKDAIEQATRLINSTPRGEDAADRAAKEAEASADKIVRDIDAKNRK